MQKYLVGGAVRDKLLGLPVKERDWVVVGTTPLEMSELGYQQVGKDFPVFLHPITGEEYALARTERKTGPGYYGFDVHAAPDVTLEDDLLRRDLTINAIAEDEQGVLIDPYHGQQDLNDRVLRHVSPAFAEDPVRILRLARFAARLHDFDFQVAPETLTLCRDMVAAGETKALVAERVWQECARALISTAPHVFFEVLEACGALAEVLPELREGDETAHVERLHALQAATTQELSAAQRFAALCATLSEDALKNLCKRVRVPHEFQDLSQLVQRHGMDLKPAETYTPEARLDMLMRLDCLRRADRFHDFLQVVSVLQPDVKLIEGFLDAAKVIKNVTHEDLSAQGLQGQAFAQALKAKRVEALR